MSKANPRRANGHRRTQLRKRVLAAYSNCAICGLPVDKRLPPDDPMAAEVDEIIPVSLGGDPLKWANVRLTHRDCNRRRGNGTKPAIAPARRDPAPPTTSRDW